MIQAPKLAWGTSMLIKSILPDVPIKNPRWRPFSKMDPHKINLRHNAGPIWTNNELIHCGDKINVLRMLISPINVRVLSEQHCKHSRVKKTHNILDKQEHFHHTQNALIMF